MKREVPLLITLFVASLLIISVFIPPLESAGENFTLFFDIIAVFAFFLGGGNLLRVHLDKVISRRDQWGYSVVTLAGFLIMLIAGISKIGLATIATPVTNDGGWFQTIFANVMSPLNSSMYALLAFFVASASYRAFRAKNREATLLLIAAFIVLLGRTPFGTVLTSWVPDNFSLLQIPNLAIWIMNSPNLAGQRAIMIGISLGVVSMSLRLILGIERSYLGDDK